MYYSLQFLTLIYLLVLLHQYVVVLPVRRKIPQEWIDTQEISEALIREMYLYVQITGFVMVATNLVLILMRESINSSKTIFHHGFPEVYLFNILICVFLLKESYVWILPTVLTVMGLNVIGIQSKAYDEAFEILISSINCWIVSGWVMFYCQKEAEDNYESKKSLKDK